MWLHVFYTDGGPYANILLTHNVSDDSGEYYTIIHMVLLKKQKKQCMCDYAVCFYLKPIKHVLPVIVITDSYENIKYVDGNEPYCFKFT